jgi:hypothetical protein
MIITIFINIDIILKKLNYPNIYNLYIFVLFSFLFILCRNLSKINNALNLINLRNIDLFNE